MYYVLHRSKTMTQACIHLGTHEHLVATCPSKDSKDMTHDIIRQEYKKTSIATPSAITMLTNKIFIGLKLIGPSDDGSQSNLQGEKFDLLLEELSPLSCPNI
jgi:hypothetical protein